MNAFRNELQDLVARHVAAAPPAPAPAAGGDPYDDDIPFAPAEYRSLA